MTILTSITKAAGTAVDEYNNAIVKRELILNKQEEKQQSLLLLSKKNEVDRMLSQFFNDNYRVQAVPDDYTDLIGKIPPLDYTGLNDRSTAEINSYLDSALSKRYVVTKEYQTRHLVDGAMLNVQALHDEIYNNLQRGDTNFYDAQNRSLDALDTIRDYYNEADYNKIEKKYNDQLFVSYAKSMSYDTLHEHVRAGFFDKDVSAASMDKIYALLLRKGRLNSAGNNSKLFSLDKAIKSIARGEVFDEAALSRMFGTYSQELMMPYRASQEYITMDTNELRMTLNDLKIEESERVESGLDPDSNNHYKQMIINDLLLYRSSSIKKDPILFGQAANIITPSDPLYLSSASLNDLDQFVAQRAFDVRKFDLFYGVRSNRLLTKDELDILVNRFKTSDSAEERLKLLSLFGTEDKADSFFPGSTAATYIYNATKDPRISAIIANGGINQDKDAPPLDSRAKKSIATMMDGISFATPSVRESFLKLFALSGRGDLITTDKKAELNLKESLGVNFSEVTSQASKKNKVRIPPLKVLNFGAKLPKMTPEFLYNQARLLTGNSTSKLYNAAGDDLRGKLLSEKEYLIQLYSDDGVNMFPRLIGLHDGSVSDLYFDKNASQRFSFEWR